MVKRPDDEISGSWVDEADDGLDVTLRNLAAECADGVEQAAITPELRGANTERRAYEIAGEITPEMLAKIERRALPLTRPRTVDVKVDRLIFSDHPIGTLTARDPDQLSATLDRLDRENLDELHKRFDLAVLARASAIGIASMSREV